MKEFPETIGDYDFERAIDGLTAFGVPAKDAVSVMIPDQIYRRAVDRLVALGRWTVADLLTQIARRGLDEKAMRGFVVGWSDGLAPLPSCVAEVGANGPAKAPAVIRTNGERSAIEGPAPLVNYIRGLIDDRLNAIAMGHQQPEVLKCQVMTDAAIAFCMCGGSTSEVRDVELVVMGLIEERHREMKLARGSGDAGRA